MSNIVGYSLDENLYYKSGSITLDFSEIEEQYGYYSWVENETSGDITIKHDSTIDPLTELPTYEVSYVEPYTGSGNSVTYTYTFKDSDGTLITQTAITYHIFPGDANWTVDYSPKPTLIGEDVIIQVTNVDPAYTSTKNYWEYTVSGLTSGTYTIDKENQKITINKPGYNKLIDIEITSPAIPNTFDAKQVGMNISINWRKINSVNYFINGTFKQVTPYVFKDGEFHEATTYELIKK